MSKYKIAYVFIDSQIVEAECAEEALYLAHEAKPDEWEQNPNGPFIEILDDDEEEEASDEVVN